MITYPTNKLQKVLLGGGTEQIPETYLDTVTLSGGCEQNGTPTPDTPMDIISNNGVLKARHQSGLPLGYTLLDYIESTGTQYIDTGYKLSSADEVKIRAKYIELTSNSSYLFGVFDSATGFGINSSEAASFCVWANKSSINFEPNIAATNVIYDIDVKLGSLTVNGTATDFTPTGTFTNATKTAYLFWANGTSKLKQPVAIYSFQIIKNSTLQMNIVPAKRTSDNVIGMYDTVSGQFFTNADTGDFIAGDPVSDPVEIYTDGTVETIEDTIGNTAVAEMLLKVGDYQDVQEILAGDVTRNVGVKVLNGTEGWQIGSSSERPFYLNSSIIDGCALPNTPFCTHFQGVASTVASLDMPDLSIRCGYEGYERSLYIKYKDLYSSGVNAFKNYLADQYAAGTPVIIVYPLKTATTESVTPQFLSKSPVTQTAGSISNLPIAITESSHTTPTPQQPLDINCNNGVIKVSKNLFDKDTMVLDASVNTNYSIVSSTTSDYNKTIVVPVKPNTTYVVTRNLGGSTQRFRAAVSNSSTKPVVGTSCTAPDNLESISGGAIFTTKSDTKWAVIWIASRAAGASIEQVDYAVNTCQLETGTVPTSYQPYVEGGIYTDGTTETVEITGKNLFDVNNNLLEGYYVNNADGVLTKSTDGSSSCFKDFLPSKPNMTYTMSRIAAGKTSMRMWAYDKDKNPISRVFNTNSGAVVTVVTGTTPNDTAYIRCSFGTIPRFSQNIQLELGSTATTYEPYYVGSATAENLFKVGTYQDVQSVIDGGVTRNIGIMVLDGTEGWVSASVSNLYYFTSSNIKYNSAYPAFCSHYSCELPSVTGANMGDKKVKVGYTASGTHDRVYIKDSSFADVSSLTAWLSDQYNAGHPVIIVYPLAEPTIDQVTPQPLTGSSATIIAGSIDNLPIESSTITKLKNRYIGDKEVNKVYIGDNLIHLHLKDNTPFMRRITCNGDIGEGVDVNCQIEEVRGKSIVWNQLVKNGNFSNGINNWATNRCAITSTNNICAITLTGTEPSSSIQSINMSFILNHKYLTKLDIRCDSATSANKFNVSAAVDAFRQTNNGYKNDGGVMKFSFIRTASKTATGSLSIYPNSNQTLPNDSIIYVSNVMCIDLTLMFGANNEPATVAEFEKMFPLDYYDYNAGEIIPFAGQNLVTTGFNQWDEQWVKDNKAWIHNNGKLTRTTSYSGSCNINPVRCFGGLLYSVTAPSSLVTLSNGYFSVLFADADMNYVGIVDKFTNKKFTTPANAVFMCFNISSVYGNTYNHDICINISDPDRNGTYEPYEKHTLPLDPAQWRDKQGNLVFPYGGMHGVGTAYDYAKVDADGYIRKAVRCFEQLDLGSLIWRYTSGATEQDTYFQSEDISDIKRNENKLNMLCGKYLTLSWGQINRRVSSNFNKNGVSQYNATNTVKIVVADNSYTNATAFKSAVQGVPLIYELAEPVEVELATPVYAKYLANGLGTEEISPDNTSAPTTTPANMVIDYRLK